MKNTKNMLVIWKNLECNKCIFATKQLSKHKHFEVEFDTKNVCDLFTISFSWTHKQDHAGPQFQLSVYGLFDFSAMIYDHRHWNDENNDWEDYKS